MGQIDGVLLEEMFLFRNLGSYVTWNAMWQSTASFYTLKRFGMLCVRLEYNPSTKASFS